MAQVHRFTLPWAVSAGHDVFIQGLGLFTSGTFDVPLSNASLISALQAAPGVSDGGVVDNTVTPPTGTPGNSDPFPQYLTAAELANSVQTGTDLVALALKAALVPRPSGGTDGQALVKSGSNVVWGAASGGGVSIVDNGDGSATTTSSSIVDNGDGSATAA